MGFNFVFVHSMYLYLMMVLPRLDSDNLFHKPIICGRKMMEDIDDGMDVGSMWGATPSVPTKPAMSAAEAAYAPSPKHNNNTMMNGSRRSSRPSSNTGIQYNDHNTASNSNDAALDDLVGALGGGHGGLLAEVSSHQTIDSAATSASLASPMDALYGDGPSPNHSGGAAGGGAGKKVNINTLAAGRGRRPLAGGMMRTNGATGGPVAAKHAAPSITIAAPPPSSSAALTQQRPSISFSTSIAPTSPSSRSTSAAETLPPSSSSSKGGGRHSRNDSNTSTYGGKPSTTSGVPLAAAATAPMVPSTTNGIASLGSLSELVDRPLSSSRNRAAPTAPSKTTSAPVMLASSLLDFDEESMTGSARHKRIPSSSANNTHGRKPSTNNTLVVGSGQPMAAKSGMVSMGSLGDLTMESPRFDDPPAPVKVPAKTTATTAPVKRGARSMLDSFDDEPRPAAPATTGPAGGVATLGSLDSLLGGGFNVIDSDRKPIAPSKSASSVNNLNGAISLGTLGSLSDTPRTDRNAKSPVPMGKVETKPLATRATSNNYNDDKFELGELDDMDAPLAPLQSLAPSKSATHVSLGSLDMLADNGSRRESEVSLSVNGLAGMGRRPTNIATPNSGSNGAVVLGDLGSLGIGNMSDTPRDGAAAPIPDTIAPLPASSAIGSVPRSGRRAVPTNNTTTESTTMVAENDNQPLTRAKRGRRALTETPDVPAQASLAYANFARGGEPASDSLWSNIGPQVLRPKGPIPPTPGDGDDEIAEEDTAQMNLKPSLAAHSLAVTPVVSSAGSSMIKHQHEAVVEEELPTLSKIFELSISCTQLRTLPGFNATYGAPCMVAMLTRDASKQLGAGSSDYMSAGQTERFDDGGTLATFDTKLHIQQYSTSDDMDIKFGVYIVPNDGTNDTIALQSKEPLGSVVIKLSELLFNLDSEYMATLVHSIIRPFLSLLVLSLRECGSVSIASGEASSRCDSASQDTSNPD
jgi:hypothetical protein